MRPRPFFPLDTKLALRRDSWSGGAARIATRLGLQVASFAQAAATYGDAVGGAISRDSVRRITHAFAQQEEAERTRVVEQVAALPIGAAPETVVAAVDPLPPRANLSTDGGMIRLREAGWKEVKVSVFSALASTPRAANQRRKVGRGSHEPVVVLSQHSYQAGLWEAGQMEQQQYVEGVRRRLPQVRQLSSVNDAAAWITRITQTNFPHAELIVDWQHAKQRLQRVADAAFASDRAVRQAWLTRQLDALWHGERPEVQAALQTLDLDQPAYPEEVRQAAGYFARHQERMDYPYYRAAGLPIGSGTVESAIKTVVHHRLKRPGRGWRRDNAQGMLAALSSLHSGRFNSAWQHASPRPA